MLSGGVWWCTGRVKVSCACSTQALSWALGSLLKGRVPYTERNLSYACPSKNKYEQ